MEQGREHALAFLLAFDGRRHWYERGYSARFEVKRVAPSPSRPHGLRYALTLHDPDGKRIMGFDNAHPPPTRARYAKRQPEADHWHRSGNDPGRPYRFVDAETLILDFFNAVERALTERGVPISVVRDASSDERNEP